jgi:hypothetical protein
MASLSAEEQEFVSANSNADVNKLLLNPPKAFKARIKLLAEQILSRQKAQDKLPSWHSNAKLIMPPPLSIEQASSEITAKYKASIFYGETLVDLTGGMGVDCLALSEKFKKSIYVEQQQSVSEVFEHNAHAFGKTIEVVHSKAEDFLQILPTEKGISFFMDPARRDESQRKVFRFQDCSPDVISLLPILKTKGKELLIKTSPLFDIQEGIRLLHPCSIHVLSVRNECKELLFHVKFDVEKIEPDIVTINFTASEIEKFNFMFSQEREANATFGDIGKYVLEPNASILKAGAFKLVSEHFKLKKLAVNTHLYTANQPVGKFPGRQFEVLEAKFETRHIKQYLPDKKVNVITRNHPKSSADILKKLTLKEGGSLFLIGWRNQQDKPQVSLLQRI